MLFVQNGNTDQYRPSVKVIAKGDGRERYIQDGTSFSRSLKRERINKKALITFLNLSLTLKPNPIPNINLKRTLSFENLPLIQPLFTVT